MSPQPASSSQVFALSPRIDILPILHGNGEMAQAVRESLLQRRTECLAVPLPPSLEETVLRGVDRLPAITVAVLPEPVLDEERAVTFVPIDPCQAVIMGIRLARDEGMHVAFIDREVRVFEAARTIWPDPYALKSVSYGAYASTILPFLPAPDPDSQQWHRIAWMAFQLHVLELEYTSITCLCALQDWPWLRSAYHERAAYRAPGVVTVSPSLFHVTPSSLYFTLGELPFVTELYEHRRREARSDLQISIDGIKELLLEARERWRQICAEEGRDDAQQLTPQLLQRYLQYVRNLTLIERRFTPDLYTLVLAAQQMVGDAFAIALLETAKRYVFQESNEENVGLPEVSLGIGEMVLPDGEVVKAKNRLAGQMVHWRSLSLRPDPSRLRKRLWTYQWNPTRQCSWPPEDIKIEAFTAHIREHARTLLGVDLPCVEKFTASLRDGIDCRETLRHMVAAQPNRRDIYVRDIPPARGSVDVVVFLFEVPADPKKYSWRATWHAEHAHESTLCFFATSFLDNMVGPGIGQAEYGGALFVFPPRFFPDIWEDPRFHWTQTLEERLLAAACAYARERHVVVVAPSPPRWTWRRIARRYRRTLIPISLGRFSRQTVERLRRFHVLNGHEIRSYAARFIR